MPGMSSAVSEIGSINASQAKKFLADWFDFDQLTLAIEVARGCNLRCPGCWVGISRDDLWTAPLDNLIDDIVLENALRFGRHCGIERLSLLGGEPSLHPRLPDIVRDAAAIGYKRVSVTTNGVMSRARLLSILASGLFNISFSIDGSSPEVHDHIRPAPNGRSTFAITMRNLREAVVNSRLYGFLVTVNVTVFPENLHDVENTIRLVDEVGINRVRVHFSIPGDNRASGQYISPTEWLQLCERMNRLKDELDAKVFIAPVYGHDAFAAAKSQKSLYLGLQPEGNLLICAAHARLPNPEQRSFAFIEGEDAIRLNPKSIILGRDEDAPCCGALPLLLASLPFAIRQAITDCGGMGCHISHSALA